MNYELAKQLKDAGYPQKYRCSCPQCPGIDGDAYPPTLSELIDACNNITSLKKTAPERGSLRARWIAEAWPFLLDAQTSQVQSMGQSPLEAVAKLWLALNEKDVPKSPPQTLKSNL